jgi:hypothetical protein
MPKGPFDEEFTPEEEAALTDANALPPAEDEGEGTVEDALAAAGQAKTEEAAPAPKEPSAEAPKPAEVEDPKPTVEEDAAAEERDLAAFLEKHKDKSPEELARLAFQQSKRANKSEATNRQVNQRLQAIGEQARALAERRQRLATEAPQRKNAFREKLASDPDAATAELHDAIIDRELTEAEEAARGARFDEAIAFADSHIPEFGKQWPQMQALAKEFNYSDAELDAIDDGRALVMLSLANHSARLMKAGIMDRSGNIDISKLQGGDPPPVDPRLAAPEPQKTLGGTAARSTRGAQTVEQQLAEIANMNDAELAAFEKANPGVIDDLLRKAA